MANTRVNEFDTFSYETPADYLPSMKQRQIEENQGFEDADVIAKMNDEQRLANAKIYGRIIDNTQSLSKTLAGKWEEKAKEEEKIGQNRASMLQMEIGATQLNKAKYLAERQKLGQEHSSIGYIIWQAQQSGANSTFIQELESMSSLDVVRFDEMLAWTHAKDYKDNFFSADGIRARNVDGTDKYFLEVDGKKINWDDANQNQRIELMREFDEQTGWTPISGFRTEFLEDKSLPTLLSKKATILAESEAELTGKANEQRIDGYTQYLQLAAQNGQLAKALYNLEQEEFNRFADRYGAGGRTNIRALFKAKIHEMVANGDISVAEASLDNFLFPHKGTGKDEKLTIFEEYSKWDSELIEIQNNANKIENDKINAFKTNYVDEIRKTAIESNTPLTEAILTQLIPDFKAKFFEATGREATTADIPKDLLNLPTVEDRADAEWELNLNYLYANNLPIKMEDYIQIHDNTIREKWAKIAKETGGAGMDKETVTRRNSGTEGLAMTLRSEFLGKNDYRSPELDRLKSKLQQEYNVMWSELKGSIQPGDEQKAHDLIMQRLKTKAEALKWNGTAPIIQETEGGFGSKYLKAVNSSMEVVIEGKKNGEEPLTVMGNAVLPGSEQQLKKLIAYSANPVQNRIPNFYRVISNSYPTLDHWDVANAQYHASQRANGVTDVKDLPKPPQKEFLDQSHPFFQYGVKNKGNSNKVIRYKGYVEKVDFNEFYPYETPTTGVTL